MTQMNLESARLHALAAINELAEKGDLGELVIINECIIETPAAWYFPYNSAAFVLHGNVSSALAGNAPVRVARDGSGLRFEEPNTA